MVGYERLNILDIIDDFGGDECQKVLNTFECPKNQDVENFIRHQAIDFAKKRLAVSHLVVAEEGGDLHFLGYYALALKFVSIRLDHLSQSLQKKDQQICAI